MTRFVAVCVAFAGVLATARVARADEGMLTNGAVVQWTKFFINEGDELTEPSTPELYRQYLNFAHCACSQANLGTQTTFQYELKLSTATGKNPPAEVWVGTQCNDDTLRDMKCRPLADQSIRDLDTLAVTPDNIELRIYDVVNGFDTTGACQEREGDAFVWLLVDENGDNVYDYISNQAVGGTTTSMDVNKIDTKPPPLPTGFAAESGEGAIEISWTAPDGSATDIYAYQALCMDENGAPAGTSAPSPLYQTTTSLCELPQDFDLVSSPVTGSDGTEVAIAPPEFRVLDENYLCGEQTSGTATSLTITGLENDRPYTIALLAIDYYGNVVGTYFNQTIIPKPVTDLWEDLHDRGSAVDGGCLLAETYGDGNGLTQTLRAFRDDTLARSAFGRALIEAYYGSLGKLTVEGSLALRVIAAVVLAPLVVVALLWHALTLPGLLLVLVLVPALGLAWRRRDRLAQLPWLRRLRGPAIMTAPGTAVLAVLAVLTLGPRASHADDFTPYWEDASSEGSASFDVAEVKWHAGIRVGPYIPEIDLQTGLNALTGKGPYEAMFGDYYLDGKQHERAVWQILPMLDVDRILWSGFGQVGVGGSIGYMQKSAYAYLDGTNQDDAMRPRSGASRNTFRLLPLALTVTYRFTWLDDTYGIPVVPYVRGGLSYYAWWIRAPNGDVSRTCEAMDADMTCTSFDKAYGGSLGFQGSVGLAIRAERVDAEAAMSMRNSGIQHAGFYGEYQYAKVDGFGSETRLSIGDNTWFAGVNFEF
ncbi:MAG: hypothetical protein H0X17_07835 [Deltaproteobacteria bacterium]|nr:hypothetical protein [Deltaproteobacteria bacterium]